MSVSSSGSLPLRVLIALTVLVLLAHLAVLRATPMTLARHMNPLQSQPARAFTTRTVELAPVKPAAPAQSVTPAAAAPVPRKQAPRVQTGTARSSPAELHVSSAIAADPLPPAAPAALDSPSPAPDGPSPSDQAGAQLPAEVDQLASAPRPPREPASPAGAYSVPVPVRLKYTVQANKFPFNLSSELLWQHNGQSFEAQLAFSAFGQARVQTSRGEVTPQGLAPLRFSDKYRSEVAAHFDREKGKVTFSANTADVPLLAGAQDRLSILVQLAAMIAGAPDSFPQATTIAIQTIGPRDADTWLFTVGQEETLTLPGGEQTTLKLVRNPRQPFDQRVEVWLAPALGYLPARIRITESNGDFVDQQWLSTEPQI